MGGNGKNGTVDATRLTRLSPAQWTIRLEDGKAIVCAAGADALERECQKPTPATKDYLAKMRNREMVPDEGKALLFDIFDFGRFARGEARIIERAFEWTAWGKPSSRDDIKPDPVQETAIIDAQTEEEALTAVYHVKGDAVEVIKAKKRRARTIAETERLRAQELAAEEERKAARDAVDKARSKVMTLIRQRELRKAALLGQQSVKA